MTNLDQPRTLGDWLDARRVDLDLSWAELQEMIDIGREGLRKIRAGLVVPQSRTQRRIEAAVNWSPGSVRAILDGGEPTITDETPEQMLYRAYDLAQSPAEFRRLVQAVLAEKEGRTRKSNRDAS